MDPVLSQITDSVTRATSLEELTRPLLELLQAVCGLESTYLTTIDEKAGVQNVVYARNIGTLMIPEGISVPWGDTLCKRSLDEGRVFTADVPACWGDSEAAAALGIQTYASLPVRSSAGRLYGTLCAASARRAALPADGERMLGLFAHLIAQHLEREQLMADLGALTRHLATCALTDELTGLPNRRHFQEEARRLLAQSRRDGSALVIAFIDLNDFKAVNDRYGHAVGDKLLAALAGTIQKAARAGDFVARLGGDEFVLIARSQRDSVRVTAAALGKRLQERTAQRIQIDNLSIDYTGATVGIVIAEDGLQSVDELVAEADAHMYEAKRERKRELA